MPFLERLDGAVGFGALIFSVGFTLIIKAWTYLDRKNEERRLRDAEARLNRMQEDYNFSR